MFRSIQVPGLNNQGGDYLLQRFVKLVFALIYDCEIEMRLGVFRPSDTAVSRAAAAPSRSCRSA